MRSFRPLFAALLLCSLGAFAACPPAHAAPSRMPVADIPELSYPGPAFVLPAITSTWGGGPTSLPYNSGATSPQLVSHALSIAGVQQVMTELGERGFVRRADGDIGFTGVGRSTVIISFEKPGVPIQEEQPFVYVSSFAMYRRDWNGFIPVTMVMGASASDSAGFPVCRPDPAMPPVGLVSIVTQSFNDGELGQQTVGDMYRLAYSIQPWVYDSKSPTGVTFLRNEVRTTSAEMTWWQGYGEAVTMGAIQGSTLGGLWGAARGGIPGMGTGAAWGAFSGASTAAIQYQLQNPYPR
jgi:hypothetical protein